MDLVNLLVIVPASALALYLLRRCGPRALLLYFAWAYTAGLVATVALTAI